MPAESTVDVWREYMAEVYYSVDVKPRLDDFVSGEMIELPLGRLGLSNFRANQQRVFRYAEAAKSDSADNFVFLFPIREKLYFDQRGRAGFIDPGNVVILRSSEFYEAACPDGFENVTIKVPAPLMRSRVPAIDDLCAQFDVANPVLGAIVSDMALKLMRSESEWPSGIASQLSENILDLLGLMLDSAEHKGHRDFDDRSLMAAMFKRICGYLRENLGDHELSPVAVALNHRISLRYLHKLFERNGTTFGRWLMEVRLQEARRRILSDPQHAMTLQWIAFSCGFTSQSHFSTQYRARFNETPRETRLSSS
ncbi:MAG TPA: AraC family transcriptional regulator [Hypericibacter adhaerens]|uniref:AraC family transcriptional regulator n=1 Tax=Hypericibacter adhaerens TaxID=2602016 RepID=A0A5J6MYY4_9PROT|nr:AraC family transcriptional regulator [Hypericibacter adhaerens]QEX22958.1 AraC family transcriptional regulator [Hypericibacter adhaerens]HWA43549.1 AraC family transcriptional regulator [Hypericibacter adhaerens]